MLRPLRGGPHLLSVIVRGADAGRLHSCYDDPLHLMLSLGTDLFFWHWTEEKIALTRHWALGPAGVWEKKPTRCVFNGREGAHGLFCNDSLASSSFARP